MIYRERLAITQAVGYSTSDTDVTTHFLQRCNALTNQVALQGIYMQTPSPSWDRCVELIKASREREEIRGMQFAATPPVMVSPKTVYEKSQGFVQQFKPRETKSNALHVSSAVGRIGTKIATKMRTIAETSEKHPE